MNEQEWAVVEAINAARVARGLPALLRHGALGDAARRHAADMATHPGMVHVGSDGSDGGRRIREAGYAWRQWAEVVGWGFDGDPARMVAWWLSSADHAPYLLAENVVDVGAGCVDAPGSQWRFYWTVDFGRTDAALPSPPPRPYTSHIPVVVAPAPAPAPAGIDLLPYLRGDGRAYMVLHPGGAQEKFRTLMRSANRWLQLKNGQWEEFWFTDEFVWRGKDTSPGDGQYYRQFEDGQEGARWCPRRMVVGQAWESPALHTVQTYRKADCQPVGHARNGRATNRLTMVARHAAVTWNGVTVEDVIEVSTHTGESMFFGRGYGLVGWVSAWGSSAISFVLPAQEADNEPEVGCFG